MPEISDFSKTARDVPLSSHLTGKYYYNRNRGETRKRRCSLWVAILVVFWLIGGACAGPEVAEKAYPSKTGHLVRFESPELDIQVVGIIGVEHGYTLVEDSGWREYLFQIKNLSDMPLTVKNVKLSNVEGRYLESAAAYEQIIRPPDVAAEVAGDIATKGAGIAVGQVIPYGGLIIGVFSNVASVSSAGARANAKRSFFLRVLKNVELAPKGQVRGSAFFQDIDYPKALIIDYVLGDSPKRIEFPMPTKQP
jgi:hypothetical protein